ncbi:MAG: glycosyltransferase family 9 protein [Phycisphaerales bacterium]|nr:glycosyltransferase family 9 protein [Phycisphaerales bacterium]
MKKDGWKSELDPQRILFIRPSALGDVCRSVPVIASLKQKWPNSTIDWLVQDSLAAAISDHPALSNVLRFPRQQLKRWYLPNGFLKTRRFLKELRLNKYDLVLDGQGLGRSGLFSLATRSPIRIGFATAREGGKYGYTKQVNAKSIHTVDRMLELVEAAGATPLRDMRLYTNAKDKDWWSERRTSLGIKNYAVIAPTSRWKSKQWPIERFVKVAEFLFKKGIQPIIVGSPQEKSQVELLSKQQNTLCLLDEMSIGRLLAVIEHAKIVVANDSAALHISIGFSRPCVGLFGPTDPEKVGPYNQINSIVSADVDYSKVKYRDKKIGDEIMRQIEVSDVLHKIEENTHD